MKRRLERFGAHAGPSSLAPAEGRPEAPWPAVALAGRGSAAMARTLLDALQARCVSYGLVLTPQMAGRIDASAARWTHTGLSPRAVEPGGADIVVCVGDDFVSRWRSAVDIVVEPRVDAAAQHVDLWLIEPTDRLAQELAAAIQQRRR